MKYTRLHNTTGAADKNTLFPRYGYTPDETGIKKHFHGLIECQNEAGNASASMSKLWVYRVFRAPVTNEDIQDRQAY